MGIKVNKDGKLLKTTIRAKDIVLYSEINFLLLVVVVIMISMLNVLYLMSAF